jgi:replicative DNA helicase
LITERFLNACFSLILNKKCKVRRTRALYRDILEVLEFIETKDKIDVSIDVRNKLDCLKKICKLLVEGRQAQGAVESVTWSEKYKHYADFIDMKMTEDVDDEQFQEFLRQVRIRKKINALFKNYDALSNVIDSIKDGTFDSMDDLLEDYESTIKILYANLMETNRTLTVEAAASLDIVKDDYQPILEMIKKKYEYKNTTSTGFPFIDEYVMPGGGYEPSRLYIFGGGSGAGKSTMLNNSILWSAMNNKSKTEAKPGEVNKVYIYITLENTIEEAWMRTYQPLYNKTIPEVLSEITREGFDYIRDKVRQRFLDSNASIIMKYYPAMTISSVDIMGVLDEAIDQYGKDAIAGLYIDYLDLLKTDTRYDLYRLELGHITLSLKSLAVQYNIPVITASQLGRDIYKIHSSEDLNVGLMSESIKKVEHADFVALLALGEKEDTVFGKVGKNRAGKSNVSLQFKVDFKMFKFMSVDAVSKKSNDATCEKKGSMSSGGIATL